MVSLSYLVCLLMSTWCHIQSFKLCMADFEIYYLHVFKVPIWVIPILFHSLTYFGTRYRLGIIAWDHVC
jgi:hypothetical protein